MNNEMIVRKSTEKKDDGREEWEEDKEMVK